MPNPPLKPGPGCIVFRSLSSYGFLGFVQRLGEGGAGKPDSLPRYSNKEVPVSRCMANAALISALIASSNLHATTGNSVQIKSQPKSAKYPEKALKEGLEGTVLVSVWLDRDGVPTQATATKGDKRLHMSAEVYAMRCRFSLGQVQNFDPSKPFSVTVLFVLADQKTMINEII